MNSKTKTYNQKHLTMTQRIWIEKGLNDNESFASIARRIEKDSTTVLKEVKRNRFFPKRSEVLKPLPCTRKKECQIRFLCDGMDCINLCKSSYKPAKECKSCIDICTDYLLDFCPKISKAPYVCDGCLKVKRCNLQHAFYSAQSATDNGTEFQFPLLLECDENGKTRTKIFYCNPNSSWQKGMIEKNHEYIRLVIPKGTSLDYYTHEQVTLLTNHINSEARDSLNGCNPFRLSLMLLNNKLHKLLHLKEIQCDEVPLRPKLLR